MQSLPRESAEHFSMVLTSADEKEASLQTQLCFLARKMKFFQVHTLSQIDLLQLSSQNGKCLIIKEVEAIVVGPTVSPTEAL